MNKKVTGIVAYLSLLGGILGLILSILSYIGPLVVWAVVYFVGDKEGAKFHLNQSLVLIILSLLNNLIALIPILGWIASIVISVFVFVCWILGIVHAVKEENKELPLIGKIQILK